MNEVSTLFGINGTNKRIQKAQTWRNQRLPTTSHISRKLRCIYLKVPIQLGLPPTTQVLFCNDLWPQKIQLKVIWYRPNMAQQKAMVDGNWEPNTSGVILLLIFPSARPKSHVSELTSKAPSHGASLQYGRISFTVLSWFQDGSCPNSFSTSRYCHFSKSRLLRNWRCANTWAKDSGSNC